MALNLNGKLGIEIDTSKLAQDVKVIDNAIKKVDALGTALTNVNNKNKGSKGTSVADTKAIDAAESSLKKLTQTATTSQTQMKNLFGGISAGATAAIGSLQKIPDSALAMNRAFDANKRQVKLTFDGISQGAKAAVAALQPIPASAISMNRAFDAARAQGKFSFDQIAAAAKGAADQNERLAGVVQRAMQRQVQSIEGVIGAEDRIRVTRQEGLSTYNNVVTAEQRAAVAALGVTKNVDSQAQAWTRLFQAIRTVAGVKIFQQNFDNAQVAAFANQISRVAAEMQKAENATIRQTRVLQQANAFIREGVSSSLALAAAKMRVAGASDQAVRAYIKESQELSRLSSTQTKATGSTNALSGSVGRLVGAYAGLAGVQRIFSALVQNVRTLDQINAQFLAVSGTAATVDADFAKVEDRAKSLALPIADVAKGFSRMAIAARGTALEGEELDKIFAGITTAQAALRFSAVETGRVFRAFEQIISKGKVSAEEVRQQLGDQIPGAFIIFANAAKKAGIADTVAEFDKLIAEGKVFSEDILPFVAKELEATFGPGAAANVQSLAGAFNLLNNGLFNFFRAINEDLGLADAMAGAIREVAKTLEDAAGSIKRFSSEIKLAISVISTVTTVLLAAKGGFLAAAAGAKIYTAVSSALLARQLALATGITATSAATLKLNAAMLALAANPVGFVLAGLAATLALVAIEINKVNSARAKLMENSGQAFDLGSEAVNNIRTLREEFGSLTELPTEIAKSLRDQLAPATDAVSEVIAGLTSRREELERTLEKSRGNNANRERQLQNLEDVNRQLGVQTSLLNILTEAQKEASEAAARPPLVGGDADLQKLLDEIAILEKGAKAWKAYSDQIEFNSFLARANRRDLKEGTEEYNNFFANWLKHRKLVDDVNNSLKDNKNSTQDVNKSIRESIAEQNAQIAALQKGLNVEDEVLRAKNASIGVNSELTEEYIKQRKALEDINAEQKRREEAFTKEIADHAAMLESVELLRLARQGYTEDQADAILAARKAVTEDQKAAQKNLNTAKELFKKTEDSREAAKKKAEEAADAQQKAYERAAEGIEDVFRGLFRSVFDGFDGFVDSLKDSFKNLLVELALQAAKNSIIIPVVTAVGGAVGLSQGTIGGITGALGSGGTSAFGGLTDILTNVGARLSQFGASLGDGTNAVNSLGNTIAQFAPEISKALGAGAAGFAAGSLVAGRGPFSNDAGSLIGAGAALGSVVPGIGTVAGAIGGAVISAFKGNTKIIGKELTVSFEGMFDAVITTIKKKSSITGSSIRRSIDQAFGLDAELNDAFEQALRSTRLNLNLFGEVLEPQDFTVTEDFRNKSKEEVQAILEDIIGRAVASATVPDLLDRAGFGFDASGFEFGFEQDIANVEQQISDLIQERAELRTLRNRGGIVGAAEYQKQIDAVNQQIVFLQEKTEELGTSLENLGEAAVNTLTESFGSFENAQSEILSFISNFVSESQQISDQTDSLIQGINNVISNFDLDSATFTDLPSKEQFRELALGIQAIGGAVDQIDTAEETDALAALLLLDSAFLSLTARIEEVSAQAFDLRQAFDLELGDFEQTLLDLGITALPNTLKGMQDLISSLSEADQAALAPFISSLKEAIPEVQELSQVIQGLSSEQISSMTRSYKDQIAVLTSLDPEMTKIEQKFRDLRNEAQGNTSILELINQLSDLEVQSLLTARASELAAKAAEEARKIEDQRAGLQQELNALILTDVQLRALEREGIFESNLALFDAITLAQKLKDDEEALTAAREEQSRINDQLLGLQITLLRTLGQEEKALALERQKILSDIPEQLRSIQLAIFQAEDASAALERSKNNVIAAYDAEIEALRNIESAVQDTSTKVSDAQSILTASYNAQASALQTTISQLDTFIDSLRAFRRAIGQTIGDTQGNALTNARAQFSAVAERASTGDQEALGQLVESGQRLASLSSERAVSREDYVRDLARIQREVLAAENVAIQQKTVAESSLDSLNALVEGYITNNEQLISVEEAIRNLLNAERANQIAESQAQGVQAQIDALELQRDALLGIDNSVLSVRAAVEQFAANQAAYSAMINRGLMLVFGESAPAGAFSTDVPAPVMANAPIANNFNVGSASSASNVVNQMIVDRLRSLEQKIETGLFQVAKNTYKTNKLQERWDIEGLPEERNVA